MIKGKKYILTLLEDTFNENGDFIERKLGDLAASGHPFQGSAYDLVFVPNINGTVRLEFTFPIYYIDEITGEEELNPRYKYITNERKIRLEYDGEIYDLLIKRVVETRDDNLAKVLKVYCESAFIEELSKTGWSLYFDEYNGIGTLDELMPKVLKGSDWYYDKENSDVFYETEYTNIDGKLNTEEGASQDAHKVSYDPTLGRMFHYTGSRKALNLPEKDEDEVEVLKYTTENFVESEVGRNLLGNGENFYTLDDWVKESSDLSIVVNENDTYPRHLKVSNTEVFYNNSLDNKNFTFEINEAYTFSLTCKSSAEVNLIIEIGNKFGETLEQVTRNVFTIPATSQWTTFGFDFRPRIKGKYNRLFFKLNTASNFEIGKVRVEQGGRNAILNSAFEKKEEKWIFEEIKDEETEEGAEEKVQVKEVLENFDFRPFVLKTNQNFYTSESTPYFKSFSGNHLSTLSFDLKGEKFGKIKCIIEGTKNGEQDIQEAEFDYDIVWNNYSANIQLVSLLGYDEIKLKFIPDGVIYITNIKFEKEYKSMWTPALEDEIVRYTYSPTADFVSRDHYRYIEEEEKIEFFPTAAQIKTLIPIIEVPLKTRTLNGEKSNTFNFIQTICELFQGWARYEVMYNPDGSIATDAGGRRIKKIAIKKDVGKDLSYGFEYGLNLKSPEREINSEEIVTKMYVENNEWEYAKDGIVSISQADENISKESYIINLDYYIDIGLLPVTTKVDIKAYDLQMNSINIELEKNMTLRNKIETEVSQSVTPQLEVIEMKIAAMEEAIKSIDDQLGSMLPEMDVAGLKEQKKNYEQQLSEMKVSVEELKKKKENYDAQIKDLNEKVDVSLSQKEGLIESFNRKYASFIKEGVWSDSNYIEPNLYYRDAKEVAKRSSTPQITYTFSVVDLSHFEEYEYLTFSVGDKSFVYDEQLFLNKEDKLCGPQKLDVFISEIEFMLDKPEETVIHVQNFRSRFEDLFQSVVASTESLKLNEKIYDRSSNFTTDQEINVDILQNSLLNNNLILAQSKDNSVVFDSYGITVSDSNNPKRKVKIVSGGIFITKDGINYKAGVTPDGISIDQLTAGLIDTKNIQIWNAEEPRFLWDASGLKAYGVDKEGKADTNCVITFNHEGFIFQRDKRTEKAELSLTWDGLKMFLQDGAVQIGSGAGIVVEDNQVIPVRRVEIGKIDKIAGESENYSQSNPLAKPVFGMILRNEYNQETLVTSDNGELWLKRALSVGDKGTQDMAGISGVVTYSTREIENIIRNEQLIELSQAIKEGNTELEEELRKKINSPIQSEELLQRKEELESNPIRFWSGANAPTKASFRVYQDGLVYATNAHIEGDISAFSGHFTGRVYVGSKNGEEINTGAGISGAKEDSVRIWAGAPFVAGSTNESEPEQGLFKVYNSGKVYSTNMDVHGLFSVGETKNNEFLPSLFIAGSDYLFDGVLQKHIVESDKKARLWAGGDTPNLANFVITSDGAVYASDIHLSGQIEGEGLKVAEIMINENGIFTKDFTESLAGDGWLIKNDGSAYFNNIKVRGEIKTAVFVKDEIQAAGGSLLIRPSSFLSADVTFSTGENQITVEDVSIFEIGDFLQIKEAGQTIIAKITEIAENNITINVLQGEGTFYRGAPVINYGTNGDTGILIAASNNFTNTTKGSIIDMTETVIEDDVLTEKLRLRVGDLSSLARTNLPISGYGLYADNVMLEGNVFLPNAGIYSGSERSGGESKVIRFWSGTTFSNRHEANFKVYEDGTVLARNGIFEGKIIASEGGFSGSVGLGGITINDNTGTFEIQKRSGNSEYFNTIASFGTDGVTIYDGGLRIFKSLADQSQPKPNTFQYIYPYVNAINDTDGNEERFTVRKLHIWSFDPEEENSLVKNYSISTDKTSILFGSGEIQPQDKRVISYEITDFLASREDNFITYINDSEKVELEKTSSYLGVRQKDNTEQDLMLFIINNYKEINSEDKERQYELKIHVEMEYSDAENAYLYVKYIPNSDGETYEYLKYNLPTLKGTNTQLYKDLRITGYDKDHPFTFIVGVENSTSSKQEVNNRLIIHDISISEITNTVITAEKLAYNINRAAEIGLMDNNNFHIVVGENKNILFGATQNKAKFGFNVADPQYELDVSDIIHSPKSEFDEYMAVGRHGAVIQNVTKFVDSTAKFISGNIEFLPNKCRATEATFIISGGNYYIDETVNGMNSNTFKLENKNVDFTDTTIPVDQCDTLSIQNNIVFSKEFKAIATYAIPTISEVTIKIFDTEPEITETTTTITGGRIEFSLDSLSLTAIESIGEKEIEGNISCASAGIAGAAVEMVLPDFNLTLKDKVITLNGVATQVDGVWTLTTNLEGLGNIPIEIKSTTGNLNNAITDLTNKKIIFRSGKVTINKGVNITVADAIADYDVNGLVTNNIKIVCEELMRLQSPMITFTTPKNELVINNKNFVLDSADSVQVIAHSSVSADPGLLLISKSIEGEIPSIELHSTGEKGILGQSSKILFFNNSEEGLRTSLISTYIEDNITNETKVGLHIRNEYYESIKQMLSVTGDLYSHTNYRVPVIRYGTELPSDSLYPGSKPQKGDIYIRY